MIKLFLFDETKFGKITPESLVRFSGSVAHNHEKV